MTITAAGFAGTVTEAAWAGINGLLAPCAEAASAWQVSPYAANGLTQVQVAAGYLNGQGVRASNDAPATMTLTAPGAGGAWYLIAARRTWSPTATVTLVAIAGPTTGSTTPPATPPTTFPAAVSNTPGTAADQPLAWAFVAAGSSTVTVFDVRLVRTGSGTVLVPSEYALNAHAALGSFAEGARVTVALRTLPTSGGQVSATPYTMRNGAFRPDAPLRCGGTAGLAGTAAAGASEILTLLAGAALPFVGRLNLDTIARTTPDGFGYWWDGSQVRLAQAPPTAYVPTVANWTQGNGTKAGTFWVESGVYHCKVRLTWGSTSAITGGLTVAGPAGTPDFSEGMAGSCVMRDDSAAGYLPMGLAAANTAANTVRPIPLLSFTGTNGGLNAGNPPIAFAVNDTLEMEWSYLPA